MADNYKILAQTTAASINEANENQANIVYTVPENTQSAISSISLINTSNDTASYYVGILKSSDVENSTVNGSLVILDYQIIIPARSINSRAVDEIVGGITLSSKDQIRVYSESEELVIQVYGVEIE